MERPQKVLFVIDHFRNPYAGTESQLYRLLAQLDREQFEPELLVFAESEFLQEEGVPCAWSSLDSSRLSSPITWWRLGRFAADFRRRGGRLAHVFFNDPSVICPPIFAAFGIRTLISRRDMGYWYTPVIERVLRMTRFFVTGAVVNSRAVADITHARERIPRKCIHLVYNGVIEGTANGSNEELPLEILRLKEKRAVIAMIVANIRPIKRIQDAIIALGEIRDQVPDLHLVVVGGGDSTGLENLVQELGIAARVQFLGARDNVPAFLNGADIGLLCSESEGFSNSIVEYMQYGLAVVCTNTGGNPEAIEHDVTGRLYPVGDTEALAHHLKDLAENLAQREHMAMNVRNSALSRFGVARMIQEHEDLYKRVLGCH